MKPFEIKRIAKACAISDKIFDLLVSELRKKRFRTEKEVYKFLVKSAYSAGCRLAFKPIVATGKNAAEIHHKATDDKLKRGFFVVDFGVKYKGYCSDCTRTFFLGKPTAAEKKLYDLVLIAQETGIMYCLPEVYAADVDLIVRAALWDYFRNFLHSLGHGVGKKVHQGPSLRPRSRSILKKNMVVTVEPGLYFKNKLGIRIEDAILIKEKPISLTRTTKKRVILGGYS
jgi:Xaa-Pro aminopeptidase